MRAFSSIYGSTRVAQDGRGAQAFRDRWGSLPGSEFDCPWSMPTREEPTKPRTPPRDDERDRKDDDTPETPPTEAPPVPVKEPPEGPDRRGPFVVG